MSDDYTKNCCLVLLAEDNGVVGLTLQDELETLGYAVAGPFTTCAKAMDWLRTETPDLAVLDVMLSDGPCRELARELAALGIPSMVYSGTSQAQCPAEFKGAPWVGKPAPHADLLDVVAALRPRASQRHG